MERNKTNWDEKRYWNKWYIGVLLFLVIQIVVFYFITQHFK